LYAAEVTYVDHCVGRLLETMEKMKLLDDTIVVFTTDHGTHLGELGYVQKQPALLNSLVMQLPLIIRHPDRSAAGKRVPQLVSAMDFAPTFCRMLGVDDQDHMDGQDAWRLATGKADRLHDRVFTQFGAFASVRNTKWHYFQHVSGQNRGAGPCLYDLERDPGQTENVIDAHADTAADLRSLLADRLGQKLPEATPSAAKAA
jgi:arylsulfatase A-like enzyme